MLFICIDRTCSGKNQQHTSLEQLLNQVRRIRNSALAQLFVCNLGIWTLRCGPPPWKQAFDWFKPFPFQVEFELAHQQALMEEHKERFVLLVTTV